MPGSRLLLWVDAVGGYLVCLGDELILGPPTPEAGADIPILADLSRRHAALRREADGYVLEAFRPASIDARPVAGTAPLRDGQTIELGGSVRLRFRRPHPLSATARLEFLSHHRTQPYCDAILLMAGTCLLGPGEQNHVVCRRWQRDVALARQGEQWSCKTAGEYQLGGRAVAGRQLLAPGESVSGEDFSFSLEPL